MSSRPTAAETAAALRREDLDIDELVMKKDAVVINSYSTLMQKVRDQAAEIEALRERVASIMKYETTLKSLSRQNSSAEADSEEVVSASSESVSADVEENKDSSSSNSVEYLHAAKDREATDLRKIKDLLHEWHEDGTCTKLYRKGLPAFSGGLMSTSI